MIVKLWLAEEASHAGWAVVAVWTGPQWLVEKRCLREGCGAILWGVGGGD